MLQSLEKHRERIEAENLPGISRALKEHLQAQFNPGYQFTIGTPDYLKSKGYSPEFVLGFLAACADISEYLDQLDYMNKNQ